MGKEDYVQTNVILLCDKGCLPTPLIAMPKKQNHHGITGATIRDNLPLLNILPFGICTVTRFPCIPVMPTWENYPKSPYFIEGFQPLLLSSYAKCKLGGTIKIYATYQELLAIMKDNSKSWKERLLPILDKAIGNVLLMPFGSILEMCGKGDIVQGVGEFARGFVVGFGKGLASTLEGIYNLVAHPLDTLGGIATLAGTAIVGYSSPGLFGSPQERLQAFDGVFGTNLAEVDAGIRQSLSEAGDTLLHGTNAERGEIVGQAVEFVAEVVVGTKGAGAAMKSAKAGSMGSKVAKIANVADKCAEIVKATGGKLKRWTLGKLKNPFKGIFGKKPLHPDPPGTKRNAAGKLIDEKTGKYVKDTKTAKYARNMSERRKALLRDAKDPNSGLSDRARKTIIDSDGKKVPKGYEVSHEQPLYTAKTNQGKKILDKAENMKTQKKSTHRKRHKECGDQFHEFGPANNPHPDKIID